MLIVEPGDPRAPGALAVLGQSHRLMRELFPPEANSFLDIDALCAPHIRFLIARRGMTVLGTGALALMMGYSEVKSLFTVPEARGQGVGDALMRALIDLSEVEGYDRVRLETGIGLDAAIRLYERHGFTATGPFGDYQENAFSLFYERLMSTGSVSP
jgi:putative acetyltransferase